MAMCWLVKPSRGRRVQSSSCGDIRLTMCQATRPTAFSYLFFPVSKNSLPGLPGLSH